MGEEQTKIDVDKFSQAEPIDAKITFDIPAYKDAEGNSFKRVVTVPTKRAYAIFKKTVEPYKKEQE